MLGFAPNFYLKLIHKFFEREEIFLFNLFDMLFMSVDYSFYKKCASITTDLLHTK